VKGFKQLFIFKVIEESPEAQLIMVTGYLSQESLRFCRELGVARYLVKPFSIREIRQVARIVLRGKNSLVY